MNKYKLVIYIIGILIFYGIIFLKFNLDESIGILTNINLRFFIAAAFFVPIPYFLLIGYRWQLLLRTQDFRYSYQKSLIMCLKGFSAGVITPGKIGEAVKCLDLKNDGHSLQKSIAINIIERLIDLIILGFLACISLINLLKISYTNILDYALLSLISILFLYFIYTNNQAKELSKFFLRLIFLRISNSTLINSNKHDLNLKWPTYFEIILIISLSILMAIVSFLAAYLLALSLGINIPFLTLVSCYAISTLVALIPVSIYGIGTRDMSMIALFSYYGLSSESAVAFSILLLIDYAISGIMCSFAWIMNPSRDFVVNE